MTTDRGPQFDECRIGKLLSERNSGATDAQIKRLLDLATNGAPDREGKELLHEMTASASSIADVVKDLTVFARSESHREEAQLIDANDGA